jgi:FkbM family methyltransferase
VPDKAYQPNALGSDVARNPRQYVLRRLAGALVRLFGLNRSGEFATEFAQAIQPITRLRTPQGEMLCRGGHGRLVWRVRSFHEEEPDTIKWLDALQPTDVLWDVGANVGMYSVYAARFRRSKVFAFEPEAQNYALLVENISLNRAGDLCKPVMCAIFAAQGFGGLEVRYVTKGGAYNHFGRGGDRPVYAPEPSSAEASGAVTQMVFGTSLDELLRDPMFVPPTHLKIDVDGREPEIIDGAGALLQHAGLRSVLIELCRRSSRDMEIPGRLEKLGFKLVSQRSNWDYREDRSRENENPTVNMIFSR